MSKKKIIKKVAKDFVKDLDSMNPEEQLNAAWHLLITVMKEHGYEFTRCEAAVNGCDTDFYGQAFYGGGDK